VAAQTFLAGRVVVAAGHNRLDERALSLGDGVDQLDILPRSNLDLDTLISFGKVALDRSQQLTLRLQRGRTAYGGDGHRIGEAQFSAVHLNPGLEDVAVA
jgi:hypothetical protein